MLKYALRALFRPFLLTLNYTNSAIINYSQLFHGIPTRRCLDLQENRPQTEAALSFLTNKITKTDEILSGSMIHWRYDPPNKAAQHRSISCIPLRPSIQYFSITYPRIVALQHGSLLGTAELYWTWNTQLARRMLQASLRAVVSI